MDLDIRIIHHKDFLKLTPSGEIDLEESERILLKLATLNKPPNNRDVLVDLRDSTNRLTISDITRLVKLMIDHWHSFRSKCALLTRRGTNDGVAAFMETYSVNRGFRLALFDNFEEAILWLASISDVTPE